MNIFSVLGVVFVVLKLVGVITWSWWLVLSPFILIFSAMFLVLLLAIVGIGRDDQ